MKRRIDDVGKIDSLCYAPPLDAEGPTDAKCRNDATTWVNTSKGNRRYICEDHAAQVDRFDDDTDDHPRVALCDACQRIAPANRVSFDGRCVECEP